MSAIEPVPFVHEGLGNSSYLLGVGDGEAVVVDPDRTIGRYLAEAEARGWRIAAALETHLHADFVTGAVELGGRGAVIHAPAGADIAYRARALSHGDRVGLGDVEVEAVASPGHTPEHLSYVVRSDAAPPMLFSGGALIVGGAARTDLVAPELTEELTRAQFRTLRGAFADLPDETALYPTHGGGSFCSTGSGTKRTSTLGAERRSNPLLAIADEEEFASWFPSTFPAAPDYFFRMRAVNAAGPRPVAEIPMPEPLAPEGFREAQAAGALVVDVRRPGDFARGHVPGSLAIAFRDAFATWLGWLVGPEETLLLVADGVAVDRVVAEALLVGHERLAGYLDGGVEAWRGAGLPLDSLDLAGPEEAAGLLDSGARPIDVREPDEFELGAIRGAELFPLGSLDERRGELPAGRPLLVYCASGLRSTTAASILRRRGVGPVVNLLGGYGAWSDAWRD
jgi:glyoxylase-like metal-dependent hydrolase (beta-lactamase superfamily II)/rhodanese-related sulfurtransferase